MSLSKREQARLLHRTMRQLHTRVILQNIRQVFPLDGEPCELTMTQVGTLMAVRDSGAASIKEIAEATHVSPPSASTMVDKLVELGVLSREQSKADRREVLVRVTPEAERITEALEKGMLGSLEEILEAMGPMIFRIPHFYANVVTAALKTQGFFPVVARIHLPGELIETQTQRACLRL